MAQNMFQLCQIISAFRSSILKLVRPNDLRHRHVHDNVASSGSLGFGSSFKDSFNAAMATSNCESSGSFVVMFWSQTPGRVINLKKAPLSFFADKRMISYET